MTRLDLTVRVPLSMLLFALPAAVCFSQVAPSSPVLQGVAVELSPFTITTDADDGYAATESASASRFRQKLKDIPQTISILSGEFLKDIAANDLEDIVPMLGGTVSSGTRNQDTFTIRGFAVQETYLDGMRDVQEWGGGDFAHVQQVEIIKGPSSNLFANPKGLGGTINRVSKMPLDRRWHQIGLGYGSFDSLHFTVDTTGPLNESKSLLYRANLAYRQIGYNRDFKETEGTVKFEVHGA